MQLLLLLLVLVFQPLSRKTQVSRLPLDTHTRGFEASSYYELDAVSAAQQGASEHLKHIGFLLTTSLELLKVRPVLKSEHTIKTLRLTQLIMMNVLNRLKCLLLNCKNTSENNPELYKLLLTFRQQFCCLLRNYVVNFWIDWWINEVIHIRKEQEKSTNRYEGSYQLCHVMTSQ